MLVKLNRRNNGMAYYDPPFPVTRTFGEVDRDSNPNDQIEALLWIPAVLVCRFLNQFPFLKKEADELFSIGTLVVVDLVNNSDYPGDKIGGVINVTACEAMESYCNSLNSLMKVSRDTLYRNHRNGKRNPTNIRLTSQAVTTDDDTELLVKDAAKYLGIDLERMTLKEKRKLAEVLEL